MSKFLFSRLKKVVMLPATLFALSILAILHFGIAIHTASMASSWEDWKRRYKYSIPTAGNPFGRKLTS